MKIDIPLQVIYLSWVNDFLTLDTFANHYKITRGEAEDIITRGRAQQELFAHSPCKPGNIAFCSYGSFPYLLHGTIKEVGTGLVSGRVYIDSYQGWFTPVFCLPPAEGKVLIQHIAEVKEQYENRIADELRDAKTSVLWKLPKDARAAYPK
jgi:hypothetical protein